MKITERLYGIITFIMVVSLLFSYKINSLCIILLFAVWLLEGGFRYKFRQLLREPFFLLNALLFLLYVVSITQSSDQHTARFFVEKNLSLVVLPLVLLSKKRFSAQQIYTFCMAFIAGTCLLMLVATIAALKDYFQGYQGTVFFYHKLAGQVGLSAIIASLLCTVSMALLFYVPLPQKIKLVAGLALAGWVVLLASKLFLLVLLLIVFINVLSGAAAKVRRATMLSLALVALLIACTHNPVRRRFEDILKFRSTYLTAASYNEGIYFDGLSMRLVFIRFGLEIMQEEQHYLLGVGTGDAEALLRDKIKSYHMYTGNGLDDKEGYLQYGYHNELLQKFVQLGITGLLVFLCITGYVYYMAYRYKDSLLRNLMLLFTFSFFTDTLLEHQVGLVIFLLFVCLAVNRIRLEQEPHVENAFS